MKNAAEQDVRVTGVFNGKDETKKSDKADKEERSNEDLPVGRTDFSKHPDLELNAASIPRN